ncbi:MAG: helix-turn-helix domain-containing protein [Actinomycetota bacterium]
MKPQQPSETSEQYQTVRQTAEAWAVTPQTVYDLVWSGKLRHRRLGRAIRIAKSDADAYIEGAR